MKYQIYLKKSTSEVIEGIAKAMGKKPNTFIKEFIEECFTLSEKHLGDKITGEVKKYGKE